MTETTELLQEKFHRASQEIGAAVMGNDEAIERMHIALLTSGHVLLEGPPGVAKTLLARSFARSLDLQFSRIQFTADLMPGDVTGSMMYNAHTHEFTFESGPIFAQVVLADEINRTPPKTQAALLEAMAEQQVTISNTTYPMQQPFIVVATQNPIEFEGTYRLPEAQLDRFLMKIDVAIPAREHELQVLRLHHEGFNPQHLEHLRPQLTGADVLQARTLVQSVDVSDEIFGYILDICAGTRNAPSVALGASVRAASALLHVAKAQAWLRGRDFVTPDDVKQHAVATLAHRLVLRPQASLEGVHATGVIHSILQAVQVPQVL